MSKPDFVGRRIKVYTASSHPIETGKTGLVDVLDVFDGWIKARKADGEIIYFMGNRATGIAVVDQSEKGRIVP